MLLNINCIKEEVKESKRFLEINRNEDTNRTKAELGKAYSYSSIHQKEMTKINRVTFLAREPKKE